MADRLQLLLEAERRGILPPQEAALLAEARRRGLVPPAEPAPPVSTSAPADRAPVPPGVGERFLRGVKDIGQGIAQRLVQMVSAIPQATPSIQELRAYASPDERQLTDEALAARFAQIDPAAVYTGRVNREIADYERRRGPDAGLDVARLAGQVAAAAPLALTPVGRGLLGRAQAGAIAGAATGAAQFQPSGRLADVAISTGIGAGAGAVTAPVAGWIAEKGLQLARRLAGYAQGLRAGTVSAEELASRIPELAELPQGLRADLIREAQEQLRRTGALDAEQLARKANLIAQGVRPTKAMVTRDPADWTVERNLQKLAQSPDEELARIGRELTEVYQANDRALAERLARMREGLPEGTAEAQGMRVMRAIEELADASQDEVSRLYEAVRQSRGGELASDARRLFATLEELRDSTYAEKLVGSVMNKLRRFGMVDKEGNLTRGTLTINQAEELRKFVNRLPNDFGKREILRAIDEDVLSGLGEDAFAQARAAAAARFALLDNPATQRALRALGELEQGRTAQSFIRSQVINASEQDVAALIETLSRLEPARAQEAIGALRAGVLQYLESKAVNPNSGKFSGAMLNRAIREIGEGKLIRIFGVEQYRQLQNLARAAVDATFDPAYSAVNYSGTAPMLMSLMSRAAYLRALPGAGPLLIDPLVRTGRQIRAQHRASRQLQDVLAARPQGPLPPVPAHLRRLADALVVTSPQAGAVTAEEVATQLPLLRRRRAMAEALRGAAP